VVYLECRYSLKVENPTDMKTGILPVVWKYNNYQTIVGLDLDSAVKYESKHSHAHNTNE